MLPNLQNGNVSIAGRVCLHSEARTFVPASSFYLEELLLVSVEEELSSSGCNSL